MSDEKEESEADEEMMKFMQHVTQSSDLASAELELLLDSRAKHKIDFTLIDIREIFEYTSVSIRGTDLLLPTSNIHTTMEQLTALKGHFLVFYCRTGNRTLQMLHILKRMGFSHIAHLTHGIVDYNGDKLKNAPLPKNIR